MDVTLSVPFWNLKLGELYIRLCLNYSSSETFNVGIVTLVANHLLYHFHIPQMEVHAQKQKHFQCAAFHSLSEILVDQLRLDKETLTDIRYR